MSRWTSCLGLLAALLAAEAADAAGAWTTLLRPLSYTDMLAEPGGDTVWCASLEGGLMRFLPGAPNTPLGPANFEFIVREPGKLASNRLSALAFDPTHRLWIGTLGAGVSVLSRDRASFSVLNTFDGLPSDSVNVIEAIGDSMWIGTNGGLALWSDDEVLGRLPDGTTPSPFRSNTITGIGRLGGDLWVSTPDGVYRSGLGSPLTSWSLETAGLPNTRVDALAATDTTLMALVFTGRYGTDRAFDSLTVYRWDRIGRRWLGATRTNTGAGTGAVTNLTDDGGVIVASTAIGILRWNGTSWTFAGRSGTRTPATRDTVLFSVYPRLRYFTATTLPNGRLLVANGVRFCQEPEGGGMWPCVLPPGPPGSDIRELLLDGPRLYLSTESQGIGRLEGTTWKYWYPFGRLPNQDTTFVVAASPFGWLVDRRGYKWVGSWDNAVEKFTDTGARDTFFHHFTPAAACPPNCLDPTAAHTFAWSAALDSSGGHWFGMWTPDIERLAPLGVEYYDSAGVYVRNFGEAHGLRENYVRAITVSEDGRIWVGYKDVGVDVFSPPAPGATRVSATQLAGTQSLAVEGLVADRDKLWVLSTSDLYRYSTRTLTPELSYDLIQFGRPSDRGHHPMDVSADGTVWLGTIGGVRRFRPDGTTETFTAANSPLADNEVRSVRVDRATGVVWIGTAAGLSRYDPAYVAPPPPLVPLEFDVFPNPARLSAIGVRVRLRGNATRFEGRILDLAGRTVRRISAANGQVAWDGRDSENTLVRPGLYFLEIVAGERRGVSRIVLLR